MRNNLILLLIAQTASITASIASEPNLAFKHGMVAFYQGKSDRALELLGKALSHPVAAEQRALSHLTIGEILRRMGRFKQSEQQLLLARELLKSKLWTNHPLVSICDRELIQTLLGLSRYSAAESLAREVLRRDLVFYGESDKNVLEDRILLSICLLEEGKLHQSKEVCEQIIECAKHSQARALMVTRFRLAEIQARLGQANEAAASVKDALSLSKTVTHALWLPLSSAALEIALAFEAKYDDAQARHWLSAAVKYRESSNQTHDSPLHWYMLLKYLALLMKLEHDLGLEQESRSTAQRYAMELSGFNHQYPTGGGFKGMFPADWKRLSESILHN